jgi:hypothetical protein
MTRYCRILVALAVFSAAIGVTTSAWGNAAPQPGYREPPKGPQLVVEPSNEKTAKLVIPKSLLPKQKAEADDRGFPAGRTVVAGVALSAGVMLVGLHFVRRRGGRGLAPMILVGAGVCTLVGATALADLAIPGQPRRNRPGPPPVDPPGAIRTPLVIEWADEGTDVKLSISPEQLRQVAPANPPVEKPDPKNQPIGTPGSTPPPPPPG